MCYYYLECYVCYACWWHTVKSHNAIFLASSWTALNTNRLRYPLFYSEVIQSFILLILVIVLSGLFFFSFYSLPSSILKHETHKLLRVAYSYYNVSTTDRLKQGIEDMLVVARDLGYDVFNALDVMDNSSFLEQLKFGVGDGHLHYYHYNWRTGGELTARDMGIVLVWEVFSFN